MPCPESRRDHAQERALSAGGGSLQYVLEEGNKRDWFEDQLLVELAIVAGVSLVTMVWWELSERNKHPVIDSRSSRLLRRETIPIN